MSRFFYWLGALWLLLLALYIDTAASMVEIWSRSQTFAHGFLIPLITLGLLWKARDRLAQIVLKPWWPGLCAVGFLSFCWLLAALASLTSPAQFALVGLAIMGAATVLGRAFFQAAFPALIFLGFAPPAGEFLLPVMMEATARVTTWALSISGVPVWREGLYFRIPSGQWSVVEACSGLRYLIASLVAGSLYAELYFSSRFKKCAFILLSAVVPIVANWARAYLIVMLGHLSDNRLAAGADHLVYGWLFFGLVMAALFALGARFREEAQPAVSVSPRTLEKTGRDRNASLALALVAVGGISAMGPLAYHRINTLEPWPIAPPLPEAIGPWQRAIATTALSGEWKEASHRQNALFQAGGLSIRVAVADYPAGRGRPLRAEHRAWPEWFSNHALRCRRPVSLGTAGQMEEICLSDDAGRRRVWSGFRVGGQFVGDGVLAAIHLAVSRLTLGAQDAAWVMLEGPDTPQAAEHMAALALGLARPGSISNTQQEGAQHAR
jgi:exosortase A